MELNRQGLALIEYLYENNGQLRIFQACKFSGLSRRSLLYQINKMNDFLREHRLSEITIVGQNIALPMEYGTKQTGIGINRIFV